MTHQSQLPPTVLDYDSIPPQTDLTPRGRWLVLLAAFLGWGFDGLEQGIFPLIGRPALLEFFNHLPQPLRDKSVAAWFGYVTACWLLGAACGGLIFGWLGDRIGRVRAMALSVLVYSLFTGLGYFAQAPWHLASLRFVAALGMGGEWSLGVALVMECWPQNRRPLLAGCIGAAANLGILTIALGGAIFPVTPQSWRWVMLVGAAPALLTFFIRLFVPESPRWQLAVQHQNVQPLREIFSPQLRRTTLLAIIFASIALIGTWASVQWIPIWVDKEINPGNPRAKAYAQIASAAGAVLCSLLTPIIAGKFSRPRTYFALCAISLIACVTLFWKMNTYGPAFLLMVAIVGGVTASFYGWFPLYLPELFPTRARATGQGVSYNAGRILASVAVLAAGHIVIAFDNHYARMCGTITPIIYVLGMALIWLAPDTKGKSLPD
jgi:SHS family sialic acid transporter-like MFS transporter